MAYAFDVMAKEISEYNAMAKAGVITTDELARAVAAAGTKYEIAQRNMGGDEVANALRLNSYQMVNFGHQVNDIVSGLLMGQSPFTILTQQGGQLYQILAPNGGITTGLRTIKDMIVGMVTPARAAFVGVSAIAIEAGTAFLRFSNSQDEVRAALGGLGRQVGLTAGQFDDLARSAATAGGLSTRQATEMGVALARTGNLGAEAIKDLISISKDFAKTFDTDLAGAKQQLAGLFENPQAGIARLQQQLQFMDLSVQRTVESLLVQGRTQEAVRLAVEKMRPALANAEESTNRVSSAWSKFKNLVSDVDMAIGRAMDRMISGASTAESRMAGLRMEMDRARKAEARGATPMTTDQMTGPNGAAFGSRSGWRAQAPRPVAEVVQDMTTLQEGMARLAQQRSAQIAEEANNRFLNEQATRIRGWAEETGVLNVNQVKLRDILAGVNAALESADPVLKERISNLMKEVGQTGDLTTIQDRLTHSISTYRNESQKAAEQRDVELNGVRASTVAGRARVAQQEEELNQSGRLTESAEARAAAQHRANMVIEQSNAQIREMIRNEQSQQGEISREVALLGMASGQREIALAGLRAENELKRMGVDTSTALSQAYIREAENTARLNQERNAAKLSSDIMFERDQLGRTQTEQTVASRLRGAGLPLDHAIGGQIELNEQLKIGKDLASDFAKGFASDLRNGVSAMEALGNAAGRLGDRLLDMAMDQAISGLFKSLLGGGGAGGLFSSMFGGGGGGGDFGVSPGDFATFHGGGMVGGPGGSRRYVHPAYFDDAPRMHRGGIAGDEVPIIARRGEEVLTAADPRHRNNSGGSGVSIHFAPVIDARGADAAQIAVLRQEMRSMIATTMPKIANQVVRDRTRAW
jgi:hypothetical protein